MIYMYKSKNGRNQITCKPTEFYVNFKFGHFFRRYLYMIKFLCKRKKDLFALIKDLFIKRGDY
ncbi:MAG: hypothetical protein EB051_05585 [Chlamydiia bacterium]|nr:hypothetical protein [Chlamydiia bacterium]